MAAHSSKVSAALGLSIRLAGLVLFVYGLLIFGDLGAGVLKGRDAGYIVTPYIWDSSSGWPTNGLIAFEGLLMGLAGLFIVRLRPKESDFSRELPYAWPLLRALTDTLIVFFAACLTWEILLYALMPGVMYMQVIQYFAGIGISNWFVLNLSAIVLALLTVIRLRGVLFGWLPNWSTPGKFTLASGLLSLSGGAAVLAVASWLASYYDMAEALVRVSCSEECSLMGASDLVAESVGVVLILLGAMVSVERLLPRDATV